jgi:spore coat polysaccharide biosynthesis predicted glycosyltransferase SpsG
VLIALGGGPHTRTAESIAGAILDADPDVEVRIAGGFVASPRLSAPGLRWVGARSGLAPELAAADVAIVGGGVSLYEACALGVPAVALAVVNAQRPTIRAFADRGAALALPPRARAAAAAATAVRLLNDPDRRAVMARRSRRLVDGRGASRAAAAVMVMALAAGAASQAPLTPRGTT